MDVRRCARASQVIDFVHSSFSTFPGQRRSVVHAFTLLEVLLTIAIIALLAGVLVGGSAHLLAQQPSTVDDVFWKSVQEARKHALKSERDVRLKFDKEKKQFVLVDAMAPKTMGPDGFTLEEVPLKVLPLPASNSGDVTVEFVPSGGKGGNLMLVGGMLLDAQTLPFVTFFTDGTCTAFRVQIVRGAGTHSLSIDPWTCAPVLVAPDPNAAPAAY